jgi:hypothetical protein
MSTTDRTTEPVAVCWPEFADAGKAEVTVGMVAAHTGGLPYPRSAPACRTVTCIGPAVTDELARAAPLWPPGEAMAYHPVTVGTLLDEIVKRATGSSNAQQVRALIAEPLGLDLWMGLPERLIDRVVPGRWEDASPMPPADEPAQPGSYAEPRPQFLRENAPRDPDFSDPEQVREHYTAERPAIGAITNARSLAKMYAATLQAVDGVQLITDATRARVTAPRVPITSRRSSKAEPPGRASASGSATNWPHPACPASGPRRMGTPKRAADSASPTPIAASASATSAAEGATSAPEAMPGGSGSSTPSVRAFDAGEHPDPVCVRPGGEQAANGQRPMTPPKPAHRHKRSASRTARGQPRPDGVSLVGIAPLLPGSPARCWCPVKVRHTDAGEQPIRPRSRPASNRQCVAACI